MTEREARKLPHGQTSQCGGFYRDLEGRLYRNRRDWEANKNMCAGTCALNNRGVCAMCSGCLNLRGTWELVEEPPAFEAGDLVRITSSATDYRPMGINVGDLFVLTKEEGGFWYGESVMPGAPEGAAYGRFYIGQTDGTAGETVCRASFEAFRLDIGQMTEDKKFVRASDGSLYKSEDGTECSRCDLRPACMSKGFDCTGTVGAKYWKLVVWNQEISNPAVSVSDGGRNETNADSSSAKQERDTVNMSKITKAEKAAATNVSKQAFSALTFTVQAILQKAANQDPSAVQYLNEDGEWRRATDPTWGANKVYRVHPDASTAEAFTDIPLRSNGNGDFTVAGYSAFSGMGLFAMVANKNTIGITYADRYGNQSLKTSLDVAFGTPVSIRVKG